ncbi:MAG: HAD family hydrolase [Candidatus Saccharimonadales bacterium]
MIRPSAIISDADGTLIDTVALIRHGQFETVKTYLAQIGLPTEDIPGYDAFEKVLHDHIGGSAHDTLKRTITALYDTQPGYLNRINFDDLHTLLNPTQDNLAPTYVKPYSGLRELFRALSELNIKLGIFTSGTAHHIVRNFGIALPELGLSALYDENTFKDKEKLKIPQSRISHQ